MNEYPSVENNSALAYRKHLEENSGDYQAEIRDEAEKAKDEINKEVSKKVDITLKERSKVPLERKIP